MEVLQIRFPYVILRFKIFINKGYDKVTYGILAA